MADHSVNSIEDQQLDKPLDWFPSEEQEVEFLKNIVAAQAKMINAYRVGRPGNLPEKVFQMLRKGQDVYGPLNKL